MNKTAIVIDDDFDSVEIFSDLLEEHDIMIVGKGYNGKQAIDLYQEKKPDFIFLDLNMPEGSGFHAIRNIKKIDNSAKIIAVTARDDFPSKKKLHELNVQDIIIKPVDMDKILNIISN
ncbi:MAG: response regulator [Nitrosopumilus sp.]|nr:response regulator [Nitrosopumilus sp.]